MYHHVQTNQEYNMGMVKIVSVTWSHFKDRSFLMVRGGFTTRGGQLKFYPYTKERGGEGFSHAEEGFGSSFEVGLTPDPYVLVVVKGGLKKFPPL